MPWSKNYNLLPTKGSIERETRKAVEKAQRVRTVVDGLMVASIIAQAWDIEPPIDSADESGTIDDATDVAL